VLDTRSPVTLAPRSRTSASSWSSVANEVPAYAARSPAPVQLRRVPDRLVDGQPQVRRVDHEVVHARSTDGAASFSASSPGSCANSRPVPAGPVRYSHRDRRRASVRIDSNAPACRACPRRRPSPLDRRIDRTAAAWSPCRSCRVELVLLTAWTNASTWSTPSLPAAAATTRQQRDLLASGTSNGRPRTRRPTPLAVRGSGASTTGSKLTGRTPARPAPPARRAGRGLRGLHHAGREPQVPSCTTRTEIPASALSFTPSSCPSRSRIICSRIRSARKSACHPSSRARSSAAVAISRSGSAERGSIRDASRPRRRHPHRVVVACPEPS